MARTKQTARKSTSERKETPPSWDAYCKEMSLLEKPSKETLSNALVLFRLEFGNGTSPDPNYFKPSRRVFDMYLKDLEENEKSNKYEMSYFDVRPEFKMYWNHIENSLYHDVWGGWDVVFSFNPMDLFSSVTAETIVRGIKEATKEPMKNLYDTLSGVIEHHKSDPYFLEFSDSKDKDYELIKDMYDFDFEDVNELIILQCALQKIRVCMGHVESQSN